MDLFSALYWEDVASDVLRVNCSRERMSCLMTSMIKWKCCANSDGVELGKAEGTMGNRFQIKYDFDKLEKVHSISKMKFSKCKCDVLCLRQKKKRKKKSEQRKGGYRRCSRSQAESASAVLVGRREKGKALQQKYLLKGTSIIRCGRK